MAHVSNPAGTSAIVAGYRIVEDQVRAHRSAIFRPGLCRLRAIHVGPAPQRFAQCPLSLRLTELMHRGVLTRRAKKPTLRRTSQGPKNEASTILNPFRGRPLRQDYPSETFRVLKR
jgi:hypothetical protein